MGSRTQVGKIGIACLHPLVAMPFQVLGLQLMVLDLFQRVHHELLCVREGAGNLEDLVFAPSEDQQHHILLVFLESDLPFLVINVDGVGQLPNLKWTQKSVHKGRQAAKRDSCEPIALERGGGCSEECTQKHMHTETRIHTEAHSQRHTHAQPHVHTYAHTGFTEIHTKNNTHTTTILETLHGRFTQTQTQTYIAGERSNNITGAQIVRNPLEKNERERERYREREVPFGPKTL